MRILAVAFILLGTPGLHAVKWNPGFYFLPDRKQARIGEESLKKGFRGVQRKYNWAELEPEENTYDFRSIRQDLDFLSNRGCQLVIQIQYKGFHGDNVIPGYFTRDPRYRDSTFPSKEAGGSTLLRLWSPLVVERLGRLLGALGEAFDRHPNLELVNLPETAPGLTKDMEASLGYGDSLYLEKLKEVHRLLKAAFPRTSVIQFANGPRSVLPDLIQSMAEMGVGLGGPDVAPYSPFLTDPQNGIYRFYPDLSGKVPLGTAVQFPDYTWKRSERTPEGVREIEIWKTGEDVPVEEIYEYGRTRLKLNYMFWADRPGYIEKVERMAERLSERGPALGLSTNMPPWSNSGAQPGILTNKNDTGLRHE